MLRKHATPPAGTGRPHLPLVRLRAAEELTLAITCWELLQIDTHFMGRRTLPCVADPCPGCAAKKPRRYEAYVSGIRGRDHKHVIIALTAGAVQNLFDEVPNRQQLRGHLITIARQGKRVNGMIRVSVGEHMIDQQRLPQAPDLESHLMHIWGLDASHIAQDAPDYAEKVRQLYSSRTADDDAQSGS